MKRYLLTMLRWALGLTQSFWSRDKRFHRYQGLLYDFYTWAQDSELEAYFEFQGERLAQQDEALKQFHTTLEDAQQQANTLNKLPSQ